MRAEIKMFKAGNPAANEPQALGVGISKGR
jgi:hypothetical protein